MKKPLKMRIKAGVARRVHKLFLWWKKRRKETCSTCLFADEGFCGYLKSCGEISSDFSCKNWRGFI